MENNNNYYQQAPQQPQQPYQQGYPMYTQPDESGWFSENKLIRKNGMAARVTLKDWLKFDCLSLISFIPIVGTIAYLVIYFIIAFSSKTSASLKTRAQATLIWSLVALVIYILILILVFVFARGLIEELMYY